MLRSITAVTLLLLITSALRAQVPVREVPVSRRDSVRNTYIKKYPDRFFIWPVLKRRSLSFDVSSEENTNDGLSFRPNNTFSFGLGAYLFDISAEVSFSIPLDEKSRGRYGSSEAQDLSTSLMGTNWSIDAFIQNYESFYLSNPSRSVPQNQSYPLRPDVRLTNFGGNGIYVFNRNKFSLWSAYNFSERQLKSRGSALIAWTVNSVHLTADSVVLSTPYLTRLRTQTNFSDVRYATFGVAPGYSYNVVWKKIFLNASLSVGPAHHWVYYVGGDNVGHYDIAINTFVDGRLALGYSSDHWFGGLTFVSQARTVKFENITLDTQSQSFRMLIGYRIMEKGFLQKSWKDFVPKGIRRYL
jgi:hypothetical protein